MVRSTSAKLLQSGQRPTQKTGKVNKDATAPGFKPEDHQQYAEDRALAKRVACADFGAAEALLDRVTPAVDGTLRRILGPGDHEHEDLVQICFERLAITLARGRYAGRTSLPGWAASIAAKIAIDRIRARIRERRFFLWRQEQKDGPTARCGPECLTEVRQALVRLQNVMGRMSPKLAQVLYLHDVEENDLKDVAALLSISEAAAQSRLVRARRELLRRLPDVQDVLSTGGRET